MSRSPVLRQVVCRCLDDEVVEVREKAATCVVQHSIWIAKADLDDSTLSGILRLSPRRSILALKVRWDRGRCDSGKVG